MPGKSRRFGSSGWEMAKREASTQTRPELSRVGMNMEKSILRDESGSRRRLTVDVRVATAGRRRRRRHRRRGILKRETKSNPFLGAQSGSV